MRRVENKKSYLAQLLIKLIKYEIHLNLVKISKSKIKGQ